MSFSYSGCQPKIESTVYPTIINLLVEEVMDRTLRFRLKFELDIFCGDNHYTTNTTFRLLYYYNIKLVAPEQLLCINNILWYLESFLQIELSYEIKKCRPNGRMSDRSDMLQSARSLAVSDPIIIAIDVYVLYICYLVMINYNFIYFLLKLVLGFVL